MLICEAVVTTQLPRCCRLAHRLVIRHYNKLVLMHFDADEIEHFFLKPSVALKQYRKPAVLLSVV